MKSLMERSVSVSLAQRAYQLITVLQNEQSYLQIFPMIQCGSLGRTTHLDKLGISPFKTFPWLSLTQIPPPPALRETWLSLLLSQFWVPTFCTEMHQLF